MEIDNRYIAGIIADRASVSVGFFELRTRPFIPKFLHEKYGGNYYEIGQGEKCRGRVRLYGVKAKRLLQDFEPYFQGPEGVRIRSILNRWEKAA